jgi:hypothetical protein
MPDKQVLIRDVLNGRSDSVASAVLGAVFLGEDGRRYKLTEVESPDRLTFRRTDR